MSDYIRNADECAKALERAMEAIDLEVHEGILRLIADFAVPCYNREFSDS